MKKYIEVIEHGIERIVKGHRLYHEVIDPNLKNNGKERYRSNLDRGALKAFIKLSRELSKTDPPPVDGVGLMIGYLSGTESGYRKLDKYFTYGGNRDTSKRLSLIEDFNATRDFVLERAFSEDHDGAFLFSPDGNLKHCGSFYSHWAELAYSPFGYSTLYELKNSVKIPDGGSRKCASAIHSLLFVDALFACINKKGDPNKNIFIQNGKKSQIDEFTLKKYDSTPPAQFYQRPQRP